MADTDTTKMPGSLKIALGVVFFQVTSNAVLGFLLLADINSAKEHRQERTGLDYFVTYASLVGAVLLLVANRDPETAIWTLMRAGQVIDALGEVDHVAVIARILAIQPPLPAPLWLRPQ